MYNDIFVCTELKKSIFSTLKHQLPVKITCPLILETIITNLEGRVVSSNKEIIYPKNLSYNLENKDTMLVSMTCEWSSTSKMPKPIIDKKYIVLIENGTLVVSYNGKFWQDNYGQPVNPHLRIFGWTEYPTEVIDSVTKNNAFKYLNEEGEI